MYRFESNNRIYVTSTEPGKTGACVARPATAGRGHPTYTITTRLVPASAEKVSDAPKTVRTLLKRHARENA